MNGSLWLIYPPQADPTVVAERLLELGALLTADGNRVHVQDLNLEAFEHFCSGERIRKSAQQMEQTVSRFEECDRLDRSSQAHYLRLTNALLRADYLAEKVEAAVAILRGDTGWPDQQAYLRAARTVYRSMEANSACYFPTLLVPTDLHMRYSSESTRQAAEAVSSHENPFLEFFRTQVLAQTQAHVPAHIHILLEHDQQLIPALTLARLLREAGVTVPITAGGSFVTRFAQQLSASPALSESLDGWIPGSLSEQARALSGAAASDSSDRLPSNCVHRYWCPDNAWPIVWGPDGPAPRAWPEQIQFARDLGARMIQWRGVPAWLLPSLAKMCQSAGLPWSADVRWDSHKFRHVDAVQLAQLGCQYLHMAVSGPALRASECDWTTFWQHCRDAGIPIALTLVVGHPEDAADPDAPLRLGLRPEVSRVVRLVPFRAEPEGVFGSDPERWCVKFAPADPDYDLLRFRRLLPLPDGTDPMVTRGAAWEQVLRQQNPESLPTPYVSGCLPALYGHAGRIAAQGKHAPINRPQTAAWCRFRSLRFPLSTLEPSLRGQLPWAVAADGEPLQADPNPRTYLYLGETDRIVPLPTAGLATLRLCDGTRTVPEIADNIRLDSATVERFLNQMAAGGVIHD